jgi:hypothetical protein
MFKINYSINGVKRWIAPDMVFWDKYWKAAAGAVIALVIVLFMTACTSGVVETAAPTPIFNCQGSYLGNYDPPSHEERIRLRNQSLTLRGIEIVVDEEVNNKNAGGGAPDGGIWMGGSYQFETDVNCNITKGSTMVFYSYPYDIGGSIKQDRTFNLTWSGSGSAGRMDGKVELNNTISGTFHHPAPEDYIYGVLSGNFTPAVK